MYNVTSVYRDKIQSLSRVFAISIRVVHSGGTIILEDGDISTGSFSLNEATQGSEEFTVGGVFGNNVSFSIINDDKFNGIDFMGARVIPTVGLLLADSIIQYETWMSLNGYSWETMTSRSWGTLFEDIGLDSATMEYVPLGEFNIDTVDEHRTTTEIRAIDDMIKLDKSYNLSQLAYPTTLKQIFLNICNVGGISYATQSFTNDSYVVQKRPEGDYSLRDMLSFVAEASGNFAQFNRLGSLELKWYSNDSVTVTPDNRSSLVAKKFKVQVTGISKTVRAEASGEAPKDVPALLATGDENDTVYLAGVEGYVLDLSNNPLLQENFQSLLQTIYMKVKDTVFNPYEASWQGNPAIQPGDKITHVSVGRELENGVIEDGEVFNTIITNSTYVYRGTGTLSAKGLPESARDYTGSNINKIRREINVEIGREVSRLDIERAKATELIANMMGGHFIQEGDSVYIASGLDIYDVNTRVWKWGIGGFGYFPNGLNGEVLTGVTAEGSIVAELVAAGIVSADYIETGRLSSFGGQAWIDLDTGHFKLGGLIQDENGFRIEYGKLEKDLNDIRDSIKDNLPTYLWIKYSNKFDGGALDGSEMFDVGDGMEYIGLANNKGVPLASIDPRDYMWSKWKGEDGEGKGIESFTEMYLASDLKTGINKDTSGWSEQILNYGEVNKYLWNYEVIRYSDNTIQNTTPRIIGVWGVDGVGIESLTEFYLASPLSFGITNKSNGFSTTLQQINETNPYLWNFVRTKYTNGVTTDTDAMLIGVFGKDGIDGEDGYNGVDTLVGILSSDSHVIPADADGFTSTDSYAGANTSMSIYYGLENVTSSWAIAVKSATNVVGSLIGNTYVVNNLTQPKGQVRFIATKNGFPSIEKVFSLTKNKAGMYSSSYWLDVSTKVLKEDTLGRYSPTSVVITAMTQKGDGVPTPYSGRFGIGESKNMGTSSTWKYVSSANESSITITPSKGIDLMNVSLYRADTNPRNEMPSDKLDSETVAVLRDGEKGEPGKADHTYIMYSEYWNGLFMSPDPTDKLYIGIAVTESPYKPTDPDDYVWNKYVGTDGVKGDGSYTHIKYSNDGGSTFTTNNGEDLGDWIGIYVDDIKEDSDLKWMYKWKKWKGEKGEDGINVASVDIQYRLSDSRTTLTSNYSWKTALTESEFEQGKFIWSRTMTTYSKGSPTYSNPSLISGNSGKGVSRINEEYYLSYYDYALSHGSWLPNPPPWQAGYYMWTRSKITYTDDTFNYTNAEVDRAWEKINSINTDVIRITQNVNTINGEITNKVSKGDLGSEFYQSAGKIRLNAKNIDLVGAVNVISDLSNGKLGSITSGTLNIGLDAFEVSPTGWLYAGKGGFMVPPDADGIFNKFQGDVGGSAGLAARWKYDNRNYIFQNGDTVRFHNAGEQLASIQRVEDFKHTSLQLITPNGGATIKALGGSPRVQFRDRADTGYIPIAASDFAVSSNSRFKKDIELCETKLDVVKNTEVYNYKFKEDETETVKTGFIVEESPNDITTILGDDDGGISIMDTVATLWKAVQELTAKVEELEKNQIQI